MSLVLGVDVGSQSIKVVLVDEGGDVVATGSAALSMTHQHDGWAEQDPQTYCTALRDAVRAATAGIDPTRVVAMGLGSQVDGVVACDADGEPLRPAIIWLDKRATEQCDRLVAAVGEEKLAERTGLVADASHSAPKMMWIRDHEPLVWQRAATLAPVGSYLLHHLTGAHAQDAANASSTMVYDVARGDFDDSSVRGSRSGPVDVRAGASVDRGGRHAAARRRLGVRSPGGVARSSSAPETSMPRRSGPVPSRRASSSTSPAPPNR